MDKGGATMAVLFRHHAAGADAAATYDQVSPQLTPALRQQPGFIYHVAFAEADGFTVSELWESREEHDRFFNEQVKPNVPLEITVEAIDVHNIVSP
jgi:heme-degrading monooxygenase HmoA